MTKRLLHWLKFLVPLVAAFFIGRIIYRQWQQVRTFEWHFDLLYLFLSFLATSSWFFIRSYIWRFLVAHFGHTIPYRECIRIWVLSELSRYVPGTVWQYFSRIYLAGRWGVPSTVALTSALMELLLMALAAIRGTRHSRWPAGARGTYALSLVALGPLFLGFTRGDPMPLVGGFRLDVVGSALMLIGSSLAWAILASRRSPRPRSLSPAP